MRPVFKPTWLNMLQGGIGEPFCANVVLHDFLRSKTHDRRNDATPAHLKKKRAYEQGDNTCEPTARPILPKPLSQWPQLFSPSFPFGVLATKRSASDRDSFPRSRGHTSSCSRILPLVWRSESHSEVTQRRGETQDPTPAVGATSSKNQRENRERPDEARRILLCWICL